MNRIYKVIWSKTKHCYVVVSELAKRQTKGGSAGGCRMMTARLLSTLLLGAYLVGGYSLPSAWAADPEDIEARNITAQSITVGDVHIEPQSISVGLGDSLGGSFFSISIPEAAGSSYSMAIGAGSVANAGNSVAMLGGVTDEDAMNSLAIGADSLTYAENSIAVLGGMTDEHATNSIAIGRGKDTPSLASAENSLAVLGGMAGNHGTNSIALGGALGQDANNNDIFVSSTTYGPNSVALLGGTAGYSDNTEGTLTQPKNALAIGLDSVAGGSNSIAIGSGGKDGAGHVVGSNANAENSLAVFGGRTVYDDSDSTNVINATNSIALGGAVAVDADNNIIDNTFVSSIATGTYSIAMLGGTTEAGATNSLAIGRGAQATLSDSIALGSGAVADRAKYDETNYTAYLGDDTGTTKTGSAWRATANAIAIGHIDTDDTKSVTRQIIGVAAGTEDTDAVNVAQLRAATFDMQGITRTETGTPGEAGYVATTTIENNLSVSSDGKVKWGNGAQATGDNSTAFGSGTTASDMNATAFGSRTIASSDNSTAFGAGTTAKGESSTAFGSGTTASGVYSTAFGEGTLADGSHSTAWGDYTQALSHKSTAFGDHTTAGHDNATAWGYETTAGDRTTTAFGVNTAALMEGATAWGHNTKAGKWTVKDDTGKVHDLIIETYIDNNPAAGERELWGVKYAENKGTDDVFIGGQTSYTSAYTELEGRASTDLNVTMQGNYATAWGNGTEAEGDYSTAFGNFTKTAAVTSFKYAGKEAKVVSEEVVVKDANGNPVMIYDPGDPSAPPIEETVTKYIIADADNQKLSDTYFDSEDAAMNEIVQNGTITGGYGATAFGLLTEAKGAHSTAFGVGTTAEGIGATAWGNGAQATGDYSTAFGNGSVANASNSLAALGGTTAEDAVNSLAVGLGAQTTLPDSIALGSGAVADRAKYDGTDNKYTAYLGDETGETKTGSAWRSTANAIAIGHIDTTDDTKSVTRQIIGVAAGTEDTDAVNVAQLKAATFDMQGITRTETGIPGETGYVATTTIENNLSVSSDGKVKWGKGTKAEGDSSTAGGYFTKANGQYATAFGYRSIAAGDNSTAFGSNTQANGQYTTAFGSTTQANGQYATAFGMSTEANGQYTTAFGRSTEANGYNSTAFGNTTKANGQDATAFGSSSIAAGDYSTAFGSGTQAGKLTYKNEDGSETEAKIVEYTTDAGDRKYKIVSLRNENDVLSDNNGEGFYYSAALNNSNLTKQGDYSTAFGSSTEALGDFSTAFGSNTQANGKFATAFGSSTKANGQYSTAFGSNTVASGDNSTAFGSSTKATGPSSTAFGSITEASGPSSTAFGSTTQANGEYSTAFGSSTKANGQYATAFGSNTQAGKLTYKKDGRDIEAKIVEYTTAAGNKKYKIVSLRNENDVLSDNNGAGFNMYESAFLDNNLTRQGDYSTAFGSSTKAFGDYSTAWGFSAQANGDYSTAFGYDTEASGTGATAWGSGTKAGGDYSTAWGFSAQANGTYSTAFGNGSVANAYNSLAALGGTTGEKATNSVAIGTGATVGGAYNSENPQTAGANAFAFGNGAQATLSDSVALGSGAVANRAKYNASNNAYKAYLNEDDNNQKTDPAWRATHNAIAVGASATDSDTATVTRQITGVAAGTYDTDAVNVAQLKAASTALTSGGLKFGANANADTAATSAVVTNALGSTVNVVGTEAVSEHTYSTDNITTEISQDTDGNSTITVKFDENPSFSSVTVGDTTVGDGTVTLGSTASLSATGLTVGNTSVTDTGLAISDGPSVTSTGIDAGSKKITRVLAGEADTDAANVGQLNTATSGIKGITRSGDETDGYTTTIEGKLSVSSNGAFRISGDKFTVDSDGAISAAGGKFSVNSSGSLTIGSETQNTSVSDAGLTITDGPSVTTSGIDAGGKKITNVLKGEADTDAVNVKQLSDALLTYSSTGALDTGKGMTINSAKLEVNAGEGLTFDTEENGYKLKVNAGEGLTIDAANENALKVNAGGGLTIDDGALKVNAGEGLTIDTEENGYKLKVDKSAISGTIAENNTGFVTGGDVHSALALKADASSVYTKEETDTKLTAKANAATTLEGYGITDAYTIDTADAKFATLTGATLSNATLTDATISSGSIAEGVTIGTGDSAITVGSLKSSVATNANNINTLTTTVSGHTASISALDATVNDADTGLVKKVGDNTASIGENAFNISSLQATVGNHTEAIGTINSSITDINTSITALDTNKANVGLDNVTDAGKSVVRGLAKESVKVVTGTYTTVDKGIDGNADAYTVNVTADGVVDSNNTGLVTGGAVYSALQAYQPDGEIAEDNAKAVSGGTVFSALSAYAKADGATLSSATLTGATISSGSIAEEVKLGGADSTITVGSLKTSVATNTNDISTLKSTVNGHADSISALDETVGNASSGLVKDVSSLQTTVSGHTTAIGEINTSITGINSSISSLSTGKANVDLDNISDTGKAAVRSLISVVQGNNVTVTKSTSDTGVDTYTISTAGGVTYSAGDGIAISDSNAISVAANGLVEEGNAKAVSGGTVFTAIETAKTDVNAETETKIATAKTDIAGEMETKLASKANASDVYTKAETYSQAEVDATLADYVKTEGATLTGATLTNATLSNAAIGSGSIADDVMLGDSISVGALKSSVSENTSAISSLKSTVGDDNSGLVQKVNTNESSIKTLQDKTQNMTATEGVTTIDGTLSAGATTVSSMTDGTATLSGGALTGVTTITASGAISGGSLNVGTGAISGGMATVTGLTVGETNVTTALTTEGAVAANNAGFVSGGAVYSALQAFKPDGKVEEGDTKAVSGDTVFKVTSGLDARIKTNADAIATKADASTVTELSGKVTANEAAIKTNADNITTLTGKVNANETAIKANTDNITTLSGKVNANEAAIKTNATNIAANKTAIETNATNIAANKTAIETNATNIAANKTAIETNATNIAANKTAIETNATNIAANKTAIETNATNIAANKTAIEKNAGDITALSTKVSVNETVLAQKADKANTLKGYGIEDAYTKEESDTLLNKKADKTEFEAVKVVVGDANSGLVKDVNDLKNASQNITADDQGNTKVDGTLVVEDTIVVQGKDVTSHLITDGKVEDNNHGYVDGDKVYDYLNKGKDGDGKVKLATESKQIAMGQGSEAGGSESIAIGNAAGGQNNEASGTQSIAIGFGNKVTGDHSGAIGDPSVINGTNSYSVGNSNTVADGSDNVFVLGNNVNVTGRNTVVLGGSSDGTAMNVSGNNSVVLGAGSDGSEDNVISVGAEGNERRITHVAPGTDANDAATVGQVQDVAQGAYNNAVNLSNSINKVDSRLNKVGAGAAALAALHPLDTDDKFTMGLGYGNYRSANAMAMGMFYRPTDKMMISVGSAFGNGENMINAGISFALDKNKGFNTSKALMARNIKALSAENAAIKEENADMKKQLNAQDAKLTTQEAEIQALKAALARLEAKIGK